ncbi:MAG: hypothetical protein B0D94_01365 [Candidatus Sedimenticola endophacoides]|nr:MAG: hypothetical protein B0D94_01365 [Candidatus Sedimenticola endophacoides]
MTHEELARLIRRGIPVRWTLRGRVPEGELLQVQVIRITDIDGGGTEYHGWAEVAPAGAARQTIGNLQGVSIHGRPLQVRKFQWRSRLRDRRQHQHPEAAAAFAERRRGERRRGSLRIEIVSDSGGGVAAMLPPTDLSG